MSILNKTKTIVTIGPSSKDIEVIKQLIQNGTDVFRLDLSNSDRLFCNEIIDKIDEANEKLGTNVSILFDILGPTISVGELLTSHVFLKKDDTVRIYMDKIVGDSTKFSVSYPNLINDVRIGSIIKLSFGIIELEVIDKEDDYILCNVNKEGVLTENTYINVPSTKLNMPFLSEKDKDDIKYASSKNIDFIALSFVSTLEDVLEVNDLLIELENDHIGIISKIENEQSLDNLNEIINASDGILIDRGDLGIEIPLERVPGIQKMVINKCNMLGKISIVATEMISSMENSLMPTRAEVSDIANAVLQGCDAVMLTDETTIGKYPIETLKMMEKIIRESEMGVDYLELMDKASRNENKDITGIIAHSVIDGANRINADAIITPTNSGYTAKKISRFRPPCPILAVSPNKDVVKNLNLYYGVIPRIIKNFDSLDKMIKESKNISIEVFNLKEKDKIIITGGYPFKEVKNTNFMKIEEL